jgi:glucose-like phosphotransferase system IIB component
VGAAAPVVSAPAGKSAPAARVVTLSAADRAQANAVLQALGGPGNVKTAEPVAMTRLRFELRDKQRVNEAALQSAGASGVLRVSDGVVHVVVGQGAERLGAAVDEVIAAKPRAG